MWWIFGLTIDQNSISDLWQIRKVNAETHCMKVIVDTLATLTLFIRVLVLNSTVTLGNQGIKHEMTTSQKGVLVSKIYVVAKMSTFTRFPLLCNTFRLHVEIKIVSWLNSAPVEKHFITSWSRCTRGRCCLIESTTCKTWRHSNSALNYPPRWHINIRVEIGVCLVPSKPPIAPSIAIGNSS